MAIDRRQMSGYLPLRDAIDRLFAGSVISPQAFSMQEGFPQSDLYMTDEDVVLCMSVPGAKPDDIHVSVTGDTVTISGEVRHQHEMGPQSQSGQSQTSQSHSGQSQSGRTQGQSSSGQAGGRQTQPQMYFREIWSGRFQRSFTLPIQVDADKADASFDNGILTVKLPKSEATKPRRIQVQSNSGKQGKQGKQGQEQLQKETVPVSSGSDSGS